MKKYQNYLIDLDGTLTDSGKPIIESVQYALSHFDMNDLPYETLRKFIGPSLMDSFRNVCHMSEKDAEEAVRLYRSIYQDKKMYEVTIYDGVVETLQAIRARGSRNILVTAKPHVMAEKIMDRTGLGKYFSYQTGPSLTDPSSDKARLIRKALNDLSLDPADCLMVGDTHFDIDGARDAGVDSCGVTYGYGTVDELKEAGADYLISNLRELLD